MFDIADPASWHAAANPDEELQKIIAEGVKAKFSSNDKDESIQQKRVRYHTVFKDDADKIHAQFRGQVSVKEVQIPVRDGSSVRTLLYSSLKPEHQRPGPLVVLIHGGGFILGIPEMETPLCVELVQRYGCVAISLAYRLSPEVKFPTAYEDCWDSVLWILANTELLHVDPSQGFIFGGTSAGSHISIPLAHKARDEGLQPLITGLFHAVPPTLPPQTLPEKYKLLYKSRESLKNGMTLTSKSTDLYDEMVQPDFASPLWSPLLWPSGHGNLPRTFFQICGADLLRDEALIYERELRELEKVETRTIVYQGLPHIFWYNYPMHNASKRFLDDSADGIGWLLGY